jgi:hypothetical protein
MSKSAETARAELIQRLHKAARIERASTIQTLLRKLLHRERRTRIWPVPGQPATGHCR